LIVCHSIARIRWDIRIIGNPDLSPSSHHDLGGQGYLPVSVVDQHEIVTRPIHLAEFHQHDEHPNAWQKNDKLSCGGVERALSVCVHYTTAIKGGNHEVPLPRVKRMPGSDDGVANVLGLESVEHHRFQRRAGRYEAPVLAGVRRRFLPQTLSLEEMLAAGSTSK
jgi:hypothetical protein